MEDPLLHFYFSTTLYRFESYISLKTKYIFGSGTIDIEQKTFGMRRLNFLPIRIPIIMDKLYIVFFF